MKLVVVVIAEAAVKNLSHNLPNVSNLVTGILNINFLKGYATHDIYPMI